MEKIIEIVKEYKLEKELLQGSWGLEKENLRVTSDGKLAQTPHPEPLGDKLIHPYITTDFSESQIEVITPPRSSIEDAYSMLENLHDIVSENINEDEYLWPSSMPPIIPEGSKIPIANYGDSEEAKVKMAYRELIAEKYGSAKQLICGIHYNFSFLDSFLDKVYTKGVFEGSYKEFKNEVYLKVARNLLKHQWLITYLLGANVAIHSSYTCNCDMKKYQQDDEYLFDKACSYRNSICGYRNKENFRVSFDSVDENVRDLKNLISSGQLNGVNEYYSPVRLKHSGDNNSTDLIEKDGIEYIELRMIDLNPLTKVGIDKRDLYLIHLIIISSLLYPCSGYDTDEQDRATKNQNFVSFYGQDLTDELKEEGLTFLNRLKSFLENLSIDCEMYKEIISEAIERVKQNKNTYSKDIYKMIKEDGYINHHLKLSKLNKELSLNKSYSLKGYEDLELSTQILIKEAILKGLKINMMDRGENFISVSKGDKTEYIKQATKTSLDSYSTALVMENKAVTKQVLLKHNVSVPKGGIYTVKSAAISDYENYREKKIVIKPNNTNFGIGITILEGGFSKEDFIKGLDLAFSNDKTILIEEFFPGEEYRFTVIDGSVGGILRRVPANVIGDGKMSVKELVHEKNKNPLRGVGYKRPLEKLKIGDEEIFHLKNQGVDPDYIPKNGETVYLRENSNISTGGDSIDYTDLIDSSYKAEAIKAAKAVNARITGVDMMIQDIKSPRTNSNSTIIELNFNPAIHIHCYPYEGINRRLGKKVLEALGF